MALHKFDNSGHDTAPLASFVHMGLGDQTLDLVVEYDLISRPSLYIATIGKQVVPVLLNVPVEMP